MNSFSRSLLAVTLATLATGAAGDARAQLVEIRFVPGATGDQFLVHPSARFGMAGVGIALDDPFADPFVNPAKGARLDGTRLFAAGGYYSKEHSSGSGRTLPLGFLTRRGDWFGTGSVALQQITPARQLGGMCCFIGAPGVLPSPDPTALSNRAAVNLHTSGSLGRRLADGRTAVGFGARYAALRAMDGVDLLYANSSAVEQDGSVLDLRLGLTRELAPDHNAELVLLHNRVDVVHDVSYIDFTWRPNAPPLWQRRVVRNEDRTRTWGAHAGYTFPLDREEGWSGGAVATMNYATHPKIPDYEIMRIPRDPGHSWAFNLGGGVGRQDGPVSLGLDVVFEPILSHTWADTETEIVTERGERIAAGGRTVENDFRFRNGQLRIGAAREGRLGFQLGLHLRHISYELEQENFVTNIRRKQYESWMEWAPSWGLSGRFPELEVRYAGRLVTGTGLPGLALEPGMMDGARLASNFILAPAGPLSLQEAKVFSHQVSVSVPLGRR
jgi:hypothetical protein